MPDARLERTRERYRCHRSFVIVPWRHCDCRGCEGARKVHRLMGAPITIAINPPISPGLTGQTITTDGWSAE